MLCFLVQSRDVFHAELRKLSLDYIIIPDQRFELSNGNRTTIGTLIFASKVQIEILDNCSALRSYLREHVCPKKLQRYVSF